MGNLRQKPRDRAPKKVKGVEYERWYDHQMEQVKILNDELSHEDKFVVYDENYASKMSDTVFIGYSYIYVMTEKALLISFMNGHVDERQWIPKSRIKINLRRRVFEMERKLVNQKRLMIYKVKNVE
jgi:hypothetical protein